MHVHGPRAFVLCKLLGKRGRAQGAKYQQVSTADPLDTEEVLDWDDTWRENGVQPGSKSVQAGRHRREGKEMEGVEDF